MIWDALLDEVETSCADAFGMTVLYRMSANDPGLSVDGVFDEEAVTGRLMEGGSRGEVGTVEVSTTEPVLYLKRSALPFEPEEGHLVEIAGARYRVSDVRPDGPTAWALFLKKLKR